MKKLFNLAIVVLTVWFATIFVRPYWDKHWLQMDIEEAALYGTKRSEGEVRNFLAKKMEEKGRNIKSEDFFIEKNEYNTVHVKISYSDEVRIAGHTLKKLQFTLESAEKERKSNF